MKAPNYIQASGGVSGAISSQTDVTASRAIDGTVYQNTGSTPIFCLVTIAMPTNGTCTFRSDANSTPALAIAAVDNLNLASIGGATGFWVLPGNYYRAVGTGLASLDYWIEYK
jgi:hypothetical protein